MNIIRCCFEFGLIEEAQGGIIIEKLGECAKPILEYDLKVSKRIEQARQKEVSKEYQEVLKKRSDDFKE